MWNALTVVTLALAAPQDRPVPPTTPQMRFVDFSKDLERPGVTALIGRLGRMREGKRERLREGGRLGNGTSQVQISGTQYYKVPVRTAVEDVTVLAGPEPGGAPQLGFDLQLARLPDGSERRQARTPDGTPLEEGLLALWVVEKPRKGRLLELVHVIPFHPEADDGEDPDQVFEDNMRDFCAINQRVATLRTVLAATEKTEKVDRKERAAALDELRAAEDEELEMRNPAHDVLVVQHVRPFLERVRARIAELEKDG